jgi:hypothetical protein
MVKTPASGNASNCRNATERKGGQPRQARGPTVESLLMARARALVWIFALLLVSVEGRAEPFDPASDDWEGFADFVSIARARLGDAFVVAETLNFDDIRSEDALVLVHPESGLDSENLARFMSGGGRVILLDDFGTGEGLLRRFGIRRASAPARPAGELRTNPDLAIADPVGTHELALGITRVVTNHASALEASSLTPFLEIGNLDGPPAVVALVAVVSSGGLAVLGDPSALMNSMLRYPGNKRLGENLIAWSSHGRDGKRSGRVLFLHGSFREQGTFGHSSEIADGAREARAAAALWGPLSLGTREAHVLAAVLGLLVVIWIGSRAGRTYRAVRPRLTRAVPLWRQGGTAGRAAWLAVQKSGRARALLEVGKALEEGLALELGLARGSAHEDLLRRIEGARLLDRATFEALRRLLSRTAHIETLTSAGRGEALARVRDREVLAAAKVVEDVLGQVHSERQEGRAA